MLPRRGLPTLSASFRKSAVLKFTTLVAENPPPAFSQFSYFTLLFFFKFAVLILHISHVSVRATCLLSICIMCTNDALIVSY